METQSDDENWTGPRRTTHSVLNPAGPFRPVRRFLLYGVGMTLVLVVLAGAAQQFAAVFLLGSGISTLLGLWIVCWVLDTILAFLKR